MGDSGGLHIEGMEIHITKDAVIFLSRHTHLSGRHDLALGATGVEIDVYITGIVTVLSWILGVSVLPCPRTWSVITLRADVAPLYAARYCSANTLRRDKLDISRDIHYPCKEAKRVVFPVFL